MLDNYPYFFLNSIKIYNIDVKALNLFIDYYITQKRKLIAYYFNAHINELSYINNNFKIVLQNSNINYPDGIGVWFATKYLSKSNSSRINLTDFYPLLIEHCISKGYNFFLLGSTVEILNKAIQNIQNEFIKIKIVGSHNGYDIVDKEVIDLINSKQPDILLVGMGSPKQELWIHENKDKLNAKVFLTVGDLFTQWAGEKVRGPKIFRNLGFEWLFRALSNPKLYFKRYFFGIPKFLFHLFMEKRAQNK